MKKILNKKIYLAGGFLSGWQDVARNHLEGYELLDPSIHNIKNPNDYTEWDLAAIRKSDVMLANMEATNPGGYALALEIGYAKALGKYIVLVDQIEDQKTKHYFEMVRQSSDMVFDSLSPAIDFLNNKVD